jgi:hypothetical protein
LLQEGRHNRIEKKDKFKERKPTKENEGNQIETRGKRQQIMKRKWGVNIPLNLHLDIPEKEARNKSFMHLQNHQEALHLSFPSHDSTLLEL